MLDAIIVGQGIAGSVFALLCKQLELNVMVIDDHHAHSSTKIAAGIMNPLVGPRLTPLWKHRYSYHGVVDHYKAIEEIIQVLFLRQHRLIRFLRSQWELSSFQKRQGEVWATQWMRPTFDFSEICDSGIKQFESYPVQMNTYFGWGEGLFNQTQYALPSIVNSMIKCQINFAFTGLVCQFLWCEAELSVHF